MKHFVSVLTVCACAACRSADTAGMAMSASAADRKISKQDKDN